MANAEFTEEMCEAIFRARKKLVSRIEWFVENQNTFRFEAKVICESENLVLDLNGHWCHTDFSATDVGVSRLNWAGMSLEAMT